jgi:hypothetical protein
MRFMDHTPTYDDVDVERLYSHNEANVDDSETQASDDLHDGIGATHGEQSEDPTSQVLGPKQFRTISKYIC